MNERQLAKSFLLSAAMRKLQAVMSMLAGGIRTTKKKELKLGSAMLQTEGEWEPLADHNRSRLAVDNGKCQSNNQVDTTIDDKDPLVEKTSEAFSESREDIDTLFTLRSEDTKARETAVDGTFSTDLSRGLTSYVRSKSSGGSTDNMVFPTDCFSLLSEENVVVQKEWLMNKQQVESSRDGYRKLEPVEIASCISLTSASTLNYKEGLRDSSTSGSIDEGIVSASDDLSQKEETNTADAASTSTPISGNHDLSSDMKGKETSNGSSEYFEDYLPLAAESKEGQQHRKLEDSKQGSENDEVLLPTSVSSETPGQSVESSTLNDLVIQPGEWEVEVAAFMGEESSMSKSSGCKEQTDDVSALGSRSYKRQGSTLSDKDEHVHAIRSSKREVEVAVVMEEESSPSKAAHEEKTDGVSVANSRSDKLQGSSDKIARIPSIQPSEWEVEVSAFLEEENCLSKSGHEKTDGASVTNSLSNMRQGSSLSETSSRSPSIRAGEWEVEVSAFLEEESLPSKIGQEQTDGLSLESPLPDGQQAKGTDPRNWAKAKLLARFRNVSMPKTPKKQSRQGTREDETHEAKLGPCGRLEISPPTGSKQVHTEEPMTNPLKNPSNELDNVKKQLNCIDVPEQSFLAPSGFASTDAMKHGARYAFYPTTDGNGVEAVDSERIEGMFVPVAFITEDGLFQNQQKQPYDENSVDIILAPSEPKESELVNKLNTEETSHTDGENDIISSSCKEIGNDDARLQDSSVSDKKVNTQLKLAGVDEKTNDTFAPINSNDDAKKHHVSPRQQQDVFSNDQSRPLKAMSQNERSTLRARLSKRFHSRKASVSRKTRNDLQKGLPEQKTVDVTVMDDKCNSQESVSNTLLDKIEDPDKSQECVPDQVWSPTMILDGDDKNFAVTTVRFEATTETGHVTETCDLSPLDEINNDLANHGEQEDSSSVNRTSAISSSIKENHTKCEEGVTEKSQSSQQHSMPDPTVTSARDNSHATSATNQPSPQLSDQGLTHMGNSKSNDSNISVGEKRSGMAITEDAEEMPCQVVANKQSFASSKNDKQVLNAGDTSTATPVDTTKHEHNDKSDDTDRSVLTMTCFTDQDKDFGGRADVRAIFRSDASDNDSASTMNKDQLPTISSASVGSDCAVESFSSKEVRQFLLKNPELNMCGQMNGNAPIKEKYQSSTLLSASPPPSSAMNWKSLEDEAWSGNENSTISENPEVTEGTWAYGEGESMSQVHNMQSQIVGDDEKSHSSGVVLTTPSSTRPNWKMLEDDAWSGKNKSVTSESPSTQGTWAFGEGKSTSQLDLGGQLDGAEKSPSSVLPSTAGIVSKTTGHRPRSWPECEKSLILDSSSPGLAPTRTETWAYEGESEESTIPAHGNSEAVDFFNLSKASDETAATNAGVRTVSSVELSQYMCQLYPNKCNDGRPSLELVYDSTKLLRLLKLEDREESSATTTMVDRRNDLEMTVTTGGMTLDTLPATQALREEA